MNKTPIIIDCDPGVDDAFAIALANSHEGFELKALTSVFGNVALSRTTANARGLADVFGLRCTVAQGCREPLFKRYPRGDDYESPVHGKTGMGDLTFTDPVTPLDRREACDVIYEEAVKSKGTLLLFAIGPLTNIAKAVMRYPDLPRHIDKFIIMGGGVKMGNQSKFAEANIYKDPSAAKICYERLTTCMFGLNATHAAALTREDFDEMLSHVSGKVGKGAQLLEHIIRFSQKNAFERGSDSNVIHDALAVAWAMDETVCGMKHCYSTVEDDALKENDGETLCDIEGVTGKLPNSFVAVTTDNRKFKEIMTNMCRYYGSLR